MCGIIGYVGTKPAALFILNGLSELESRGYDSAGYLLAESEEERLLTRVVRHPGQTIAQELASAQRGALPPYRHGIGHTRWATHGGVTADNAHPHMDCRGWVHVVHNGVIENYEHLVAELRVSGHTIRTDVDSEVLAHLIEQSLDQGTLAEAVTSALRRVEGTFGVAVMDVRHPETIVVARRSSPVYIGIAKHGHFVSSEQAGFASSATTCVELRDEEIAVLTPDEYTIHRLDGAVVNRSPNAVEWDQSAPPVPGEDVTWREIQEGATAVRNTLRGRLLLSSGDVKLGGLENVGQRLRSIDRVHVVACGSAYYAGLITAMLLEEYAGVPAMASVASEFAYRSHALIDDHTAVLAISQSGETADTRLALAEARRRGAMTLGIVNVVGSSISRETTAGVYTHAGRERGVASTKAFLSQLSVAAMLAVSLGRERRMPVKDASAIVAALHAVPEALDRVRLCDEQITSVAGRLAESRGVIFIGRKYGYPVALEGALKLQELAYIFTEAVPAGELKHGHLALVDATAPTVALFPDDALAEKTITSVREIRARGGWVVAVSAIDPCRLEGIADEVLQVPRTHEAVQPVIMATVMHRLAYHVAKVLGRDIDRPRSLAKAVTVE